LDNVLAIVQRFVSSLHAKGPVKNSKSSTLLPARLHSSVWKRTNTRTRTSVSNVHFIVVVVVVVVVMLITTIITVTVVVVITEVAAVPGSVGMGSLNSARGPPPAGMKNLSVTITWPDSKPIKPNETFNMHIPKVRHSRCNRCWSGIAHCGIADKRHAVDFNGFLLGMFACELTHPIFRTSLSSATLTGSNGGPAERPDVAAVRASVEASADL
jgi:hypothetical protein